MAIPTTSSDLTYNTLTDIHRMQHQGHLTLGWNVNENGTYLLTNDGAKIRVQHWRAKDLRTTLINSLDVPDITGLDDDLRIWSEETFGTERGPIGPLKHLVKEVETEILVDGLHDIREYADVCLLYLDAVRRAGFKIKQLIHAAREKLQVCKSRTWNIPINIDEPIYHKE